MIDFTKLFYPTPGRVLLLGWIGFGLLSYNWAWLGSYLVGMVATGLCFSAWGSLLGRRLFSDFPGRILLGIATLWTAIFITTIFFVYFFRYSNELAIGLLAIGGAVVSLLFRWPLSPIPEGTTSGLNEKITLPLSVKMTLGLVLTTLGVCASVFFRLGNQGHHYQGPISFSPSLFLVGLVLAAIFVLAIKKTSAQFWVLGPMALFFIINIPYATVLDNLYGADGWRHLAITQQIANEQAYLPTNLQTILKFETEKTSNISLYTALPIVKTYTQIDLVSLFRFSSLVFFGPLLIITIYFLGHAIFHNTLGARLLTVSGFLAPTFMSVDGNVNVRVVGIIYFLLAAWCWMLVLQRRMNLKNPVPWLITAVAVLAYPTTGYFSLAVMLASIVLRLWSSKKYNPALLITVVPVAALVALPIPLIDHFFKDQPIRPEYARHWLGAVEIIRQWTNTYLAPKNLLLFSVYGTALVGIFAFYRQVIRRVFFVWIILLGALIIDFWALSLFKASYLPFGSRTPFIFAIVVVVFFSSSLIMVVKRLVQNGQRFGLFALSLVLGTLGASLNDSSNFSYGWSISNNEVSAIRYIEQDASGPYLVMSDETTSAAGYALTGNDVAYYWYPNTRLAALTMTFILNPTKTHLEDVCRINENIVHLYLIDNPIPPVGDYRTKNASSYKQLLQKKANFNNVHVYQFDCRTVNVLAGPR